MAHVRLVLLAACCAALFCPATRPLQAQSADPPLGRPDAVPPHTPAPTITFDVVSFRRTQEFGSSKIDMPMDSDYIAYHGQPLSRMLYFGFYYAGDKLSGEPDWVDRDPYDFRAKVAGEDLAAWKAMTIQTRRLMVKQLLIDTCHLKFHLNGQPEAVYELTVAPGGPKLMPHVEGTTKKFPDGTEVVGSNTHWVTPVEAYFQRINMANLAAMLTAHEIVDRPVINKTEVSGYYDITLAVPFGKLPQEMMEQLNPPSPFSEIQKLGLKLVPAKVIMPGIVVDHIDRPPED